MKTSLILCAFLFPCFVYSQTEKKEEEVVKKDIYTGSITGVKVSNGGIPGSTGNIVIRGISSLLLSSKPLIVIDGVSHSEYNEAFNPISLLNENDIKSITVLKDAASTARYGVQGSNGVIVVKTKSADFDKPNGIEKKDRSIGEEKEKENKGKEKKGRKRRM